MTDYSETTMKYYKSTVTGKILSGGDLILVRDAIGDALDWMLDNGKIVRIETPSVVDFLKQNRMVDAIRRYKEINGCASLIEARDGVNEIKKQMGYLRTHGADE